jgi:DNA polymerase-4
MAWKPLLTSPNERTAASRYQQISETIMSVCTNFSPEIEALSLDEAFLDMTGPEQLFGSPQAMGRKLKDAIRETTGLTASVGLSATKYVAKVASARQKPDGLTVVSPGLRQSL